MKSPLAPEKRSRSQPAKIAPPRCTSAMDRPRLFKALDALRHRGGSLWLQGIPGGGKTTLLATWLRARRLGAVWLKVDEGDADLATFFHYLAAAAAGARRRRAQALPALTPEYQGAPDAFARGFFRALFGSLRRGTLLVLDDLQEAGGSLQVVLRAALEELPEGAAMILSSRTAAPASLARFRASGRLDALGEHDLELTLTEAQALARRRGFCGKPSALAELVQDARGWPAGVVLRLLKTSGDSASSHASPEHEFFAGEVLVRLEPAERRTLLEAALLPPASNELLAHATGEPQAGSLLASLAERGLFTLRIDSSPVAHELHALFRAFLLARGEQELSPARRAEVRRSAALWLAGRPEAAPDITIPLLIQAGAFDEAARLIARGADSMLREGRWQTVERWLAALPESRRNSDPWLVHWAGVAAAVRSPGEASAHLDRAQTMFEQAGDATGVWLAWAARIDVAATSWNDFGPPAAALRDLERLRERFSCPGEVKHRVLLGAYLAASLTVSDHPDFAAWTAAVRELASASPPAALRLIAGSQLALFESCVLGEIARNQALARELDALAGNGRAPPVLAQRWRCYAPHVEFAAGRFEECAAAAQRALADGERIGIHAGDYFCQAMLFQAAQVRETNTLSWRLRAMEQALRPGASVELCVFRWAQGLAALQQGDAQAALVHASAALEGALESGHSVGRAMAFFLLARAHGRSGAFEDARSMLARARAWGERAGSAWARGLAAFVQAELLLGEGRPAESAASLGEGLLLEREKGVHPFLAMSAADAARLCDAALASDSHVELARAFVRRWRLEPPAGGRAAEAWPWPVKVWVLGSLRAERNGAPVCGSGRVQRKPLDLLRLLASHGGRELPEQVAAVALWPEAEGDAAQHALETTLYRLRRLVGPEAIVQRDRQLSLSRRHCWIDAVELEDRLGATLTAMGRSRTDVAALTRDAARIGELYRGPLLADADGAAWAAEPRQRLRRKLARWLEALPGALRDGPEAAALRADLGERDPALRPGAASTQRWT